ncbi:MAG: YaeQ family protein [Candidatus Brocadiaceae bacterium]|nr:YaeQ family protein [Candidatus Brocadiaceae bacterium]
MALKATIFKVDLSVTDIDRKYYQEHKLTIARHPSENDARMMTRLLAFALNAHEALAFSQGMSSGDEPDLWQKDLSGNIEVWIDLGQPDEKRIRKACGRAKEVIIYTYSGRSANVWWDKINPNLKRFKNLTVINLTTESIREIVILAHRTMDIQCTIQEGHVWISDNDQTVKVDPIKWKTREE